MNTNTLVRHASSQAGSTLGQIETNTHTQTRLQTNTQTGYFKGGGEEEIKLGNRFAYLYRCCCCWIIKSHSATLNRTAFRDFGDECVSLSRISHRSGSARFILFANSQVFCRCKSNKTHTHFKSKTAVAAEDRKSRRVSLTLAK